MPAGRYIARGVTLPGPRAARARTARSKGRATAGSAPGVGSGASTVVSTAISPAVCATMIAAVRAATAAVESTATAHGMSATSATAVAAAMLGERGRRHPQQVQGNKSKNGVQQGGSFHKTPSTGDSLIGWRWYS